MVSPQPTDSHLRLANSILDEIIVRDFSKRHLKIIFAILRPSWACNSKYAIITEYTKYFEACGISKGNIKAELEYLVKNKVIFWDKDTNIFALNKDFDAWTIPAQKEIMGNFNNLCRGLSFLVIHELFQYAYSKYNL